MSLPSLLRALLPALLAQAAVVLAPGCAGAGGGASMHDLDTTPGSVRGWFETHQAHPRAVLLLSPV